jgi:hypothetical protein
MESFYIFHQFSVHRDYSVAVTFSLPEISEVAKEKEDAFVREKRTPLPGIVDQKELIACIRNDKKIGFLYMVYAVSPASELYSPYCLTYVKI